MPAKRPGREGGPRARNRQERTATLCQAALELFLDRGIEATTVDMITRHAGVAKGSFYRYFNDKAAVVEALLSPLEAEVDSSMQRCEKALNDAEDAGQLTGAYVAFAGELGAMLLSSPRVVHLYLQESRAPGKGARTPIRRVRDRLTAGAIALTHTAHRRDLLRDLPPEVTALAVIGAVEGMVTAFVEGRALGDPAVVTDALISMVLDGVRRVD